MQPKNIYVFDEDREETTTPTTEAAPKRTDLMHLIVQSLGVVLLLFGLSAGIKVMFQAFGLYYNPAKIETLATAIERGSNLDRTLSSSLTTEDGNVKRDDLQLSYFFAWIVALMLLMLISVIAFNAIKTGAELVLSERKPKSPAGVPDDR